MSLTIVPEKGQIEHGTKTCMPKRVFWQLVQPDFVCNALELQKNVICVNIGARRFVFQNL
jgi:hypothetical protein